MGPTRRPVRELPPRTRPPRPTSRRIGVCGQYSSIVPVDRAREPVAPMLMWQDHRGTDHSFAIMSRHEEAFMTFVERHGIPPIGSGLSLGHILHVQLDHPDVHAATTRTSRRWTT